MRLKSLVKEIQAPTEYFISDFVYTLDGKNVDSSDRVYAPSIQSSIQKAESIYDIYSNFPSVVGIFSDYTVRDHITGTLLSVMPARKLFNYIISFNFHGRLFYIGATTDKETAFFAVVDKEKGVVLNVSYANILDKDVQMLKDIFKGNKDLIPKLLATAFNQSRITNTGSIIFQKQIDAIIGDFKVIPGKEDKGALYYDTNIRDVGEMIKEIESGEALKDPDKAFVWSLGITDDQLFEVLRHFTKDFLVIPTEMDKKIVVSLLNLISSGYSGADFGRTTAIDNMIFGKYTNKKSDLAIYNSDTLLFLYTLEFLKLTKKDEAYRRYYHIANKKALHVLANNGYASLFYENKILLPLRESDTKSVKHMSLNGLHFDVLNIPSIGKEIDEATGNKSNRSYTLDKIYYFLPSLNIPAYFTFANNDVIQDGVNDRDLYKLFLKTVRKNVKIISKDIPEIATAELALNIPKPIGDENEVNF